MQAPVPPSQLVASFLIFPVNNAFIDLFILGLCKKIAKTHPVMVSDHVKKEKEETDAMEKIAKEGFLGFIRSAKNYEYRQIRPSPLAENANSISSASLSSILPPPLSKYSLLFFPFPLFLTSSL